MASVDGKKKEEERTRKSGGGVGGGLKFMGMCCSSPYEPPEQQPQPQPQQPHLHHYQRFDVQIQPHLDRHFPHISPFPRPPQQQHHHHHHHHHPRGGGGGGGGWPGHVSNQTRSPGVLYTPKDVKELRLNPGYTNVDIFSFEELKLATKHFHPELILGEGGFGVVYRGIIDYSVKPGYKYVEVAIKQLNPNGSQGDREWLAEVRYLGQFSHPNLVRLIGYCCQDEHRLLVYEYMSSGSLEKHLFRRISSTLTWLRRIKIALDSAKGLAFLHGLERQIIYRDFKTSNILLDSNFNAKLSDFGLAKEGPMGDQTHVSTRVMGTYGYAAPEYVMTGHLTARSDVYAFGVVLLEMLIGKRAFDKGRVGRQHNLVEWCRPLLNNNKKLTRILDTRIEGQYSTKAMTRMANLGYQCLSQNPKGRPVMSHVVEILQAVYEQEGTREMSLLAQNGGRGKTLNEAPSSATRKRPQARSRSEPRIEDDFYSPSPD